MLQFLMEEGSLTGEEQEAVDVALMSCWSLVDWVATFVYNEMGVPTGAGLKVPKAPAGAPQAGHKSTVVQVDVGSSLPTGAGLKVPKAPPSAASAANVPQAGHKNAVVQADVGSGGVKGEEDSSGGVAQAPGESGGVPHAIEGQCDQR